MNSRFQRAGQDGLESGPCFRLAYQERLLWIHRSTHQWDHAALLARHLLLARSLVLLDTNNTTRNLMKKNIKIRTAIKAGQYYY